jgi:hypothetical protein
VYCLRIFGCEFEGVTICTLRLIGAAISTFDLRPLPAQCGKGKDASHQSITSVIGNRTRIDSHDALETQARTMRRPVCSVAVTWRNAAAQSTDQYAADACKALDEFGKGTTPAGYRAGRAHKTGGPPTAHAIRRRSTDGRDFVGNRRPQSGPAAQPSSTGRIVRREPLEASSGKTTRHRLNRGAIAPPTTRCGRSQWYQCGATHARAPTLLAAPPKVCQRRKSSDA